MPAYDYICDDCNKQFEVWASMSAYERGLSPECPKCEGTSVSRAITAANVISGTSAGGGDAPSCPSGFT